MVAPTTETSRTTTADGAAHEAHPPIRNRSTVQRLALSLTRLASIQTRIVMTRAKITALRIAIMAALYAAGAMLGLLSIVFLYIGVFLALTYIMAPVFAFLLMGVVHLVIAGVLIWLGTRYLKKRDEEGASEGSGDVGTQQESEMRSEKGLAA